MRYRYRPVDDARGYPRLGVDELNLSQFPIGLISERNPKALERLQCSQTVQAPDGELIPQKWRVESPGGLPLAGDGELLLALLNLYHQQDYPRQVLTTRYGLLKAMGKKPDGRGYQRLRSSLERLARVRVVARQAFWDGEGYVSRVFGLVNQYRLEAEDTFVELSETLYQSLTGGNIVGLDLREHNRIQGYIARRLYRYLNRFAVRGGTFERNLMAMATVNLGMLQGSRNSPSQFRQSLEKAHLALKERGFLDSWSYIKESPRWFVSYRFGPMAYSRRPD